MIKFTILLARNPALTHGQFVAHHRNIHADLFMSVAAVKDTVRRYVQQHALPVVLPGLPPVKYDGVTELWCDEVSAITRLCSDPEYLERIRPDEARFLDLERCDFIVSSENNVV